MVTRRRNPLVVAAVLALGLALSGCESFDSMTDWFNTKKPLPGERKAVFPEGVPGVPQGVPPELVQGHQPAAEPPPVIQAEEKPKVEERPRAAEKPRAKPKPWPKQVATPARPAVEVQPAARAEQSPQSPWPVPRQTASQPAPSQSQSVFPDPPPASR